MFLLSEVAFYTPCDVCTNNVNLERVTCGRLSRVTHGVVICNVINTSSKCGLKGKKKNNHKTLDLHNQCLPRNIE